MGNYYGYIRVSTDKQVYDRQYHLLLEYAHKEKIQIEEIFEVQSSSRKSQEERRIRELFEKMSTGDTLLVSDLSRLGRKMLESLQLVEELNERGIYLTSITQKEMNTGSLDGRLIVTLLGYVAESERNNISERTKQGIAARRAKGLHVGRPKGSKNKNGLALDEQRTEIIAYMNLGLPVTSIYKIVNDKRDNKVSLNTYYDYAKMLKKEGAKIEIKG